MRLISLNIAENNQRDTTITTHMKTVSVSSTIFLLSTSLVESHEDTSLLKFIHHRDKILNNNTWETIPQDDNELGVNECL